MSTPLFANNAKSPLASSVSATPATGSISLILTPGDGALFPNPGVDEFFAVTITNSSGQREIFHCTARSTDTLTVNRAQEGTSALAFNAGDVVSHRFTAATVVTATTFMQTVLDDADAATALATLGAPGLSAANIFTATQTITSTDAGAGSGPLFYLYRNSVSPAASDFLGSFVFDGTDSGAARQTYAQIFAQIIDPTAASEDSRVGVQTTIAGTNATRVFVGNGVYSPSASGGDKGADSLNFTTIYQNNTQVATLGSNTYTGDQSITSSDAGSGVSPTFAVDRLSASPAASDFLGQILLRGKDSGGNTANYGKIIGQIIDPTDGSEDGRILVQTVIAGSEGTRFYIGAGLYGVGATGGDKGADSLNFATIYENNVRVLASSTVNAVSPTSPNRTITVTIGGTPYYIHAKTTND